MKTKLFPLGSGWDQEELLCMYAMVQAPSKNDFPRKSGLAGAGVDAFAVLKEVLFPSPRIKEVLLQGTYRGSRF